MDRKTEYGTELELRNGVVNNRLNDLELRCLRQKMMAQELNDIVVTIWFLRVSGVVRHG